MVRQVLGGESGELGVRIEVFGRPRTKGSMVAVHQKQGAGRCKVFLKESGEYAVAWKNEMVRAIRGQVVCERWPGDAVVDSFFRFERLCEPDADMPWPTRQQGTYAHGDADKLARSAWDALTQSGLLLDDSKIIGGPPYKRWCLDGERPGVLIKVRPAVPADLDRILAMERS